MATGLGLRYPKVLQFGQAEGPGGALDNWAINFQNDAGTPFARASENSFLPIAPARYSEVRKVVFFAEIRRLSGVSHPNRLRIALVSGNAVTKVFQKLTISPSTYHRIRGAGTTIVTDWSVNHVFDTIGSTTTPVTGTDPVDDPVHIVQITFDRFVAADDDFFAIWDQAVGSDDYVFFRFVMERTDGNHANNVTELQASTIGCSIVQAPAGTNRTCTMIPVTAPFTSSSNMTLTYTQTGGFGFRNPFHFRFDEAKWDGITAIHFMGYCLWAGNAARSWLQGLHKINTNEPYAVTLLTQEAMSDALATRAAGDVAWWRGENLLGDFVDGNEVNILFDNQNAVAITSPMGWLEIIQEDFTKTTCYHPISTGMRLTLTTGGTNRGFPSQGLFDPTWYQAFPDDRILDRKLYLSFNHDQIGTNTEIAAYLDTDLDSDVTLLATSAPTLVQVTPTCTSTPSNNVGRKKVFSEPSIDPIDLAGQRKLVWGVVVASLSPDDYPGDAGFLYALDVPNVEFLPPGDVFATGAFNPEGCAATSAGLGDPGRLYISNGETTPKKFDPDQSNITPAGMPTPFPDEVPTFVVTDTALSPEGGLTNGTYIYRYTIRDCCTGKESDPNPDDIEVTVSGASPAGRVTFSFANVRVPSDNLCEICLYRTVVGGVFPVMAKVGCFDPDETELFEDDLADSELDFFNEQLSILNAPMPCVPYIVEFRNRIFGAGDIPIHDPAGTVSVEEGSDLVVGDGDVEWTRCLEGRYIMIAGDCTRYEIDRVLPPEAGLSPPIARLLLTRPYEGTTRNEQTYEICGHPNRLYWSEPLEGEFWPLVNFMDIEPGDGDRIMGLASNFDRLVIYKRRKTYVLTFGETPAEVNVPARVSSDIGMVAPRSPAQIENGTVALAERGLQIFDGRGVTHVPESGLINDLFVDPENPRYVRRDDLGRVMDAVGVFYPKREQYLLLVPTVQTNRGCNLMVVWDTKLHNITFFEFCQQFQAMVVGKDADGNQRVYVGDTNGFVWSLDIGHNDGVGVPGDTGTTRGTATGGGTDDLGVSFFEDTNATFLEGGLPEFGALSGVAGLSASLTGGNLGLAGVCVHYRAPGETVWQTNFIFAATEHRFYLADDIDFDPTGYEYMLGAIEFEAVFKPFNYGSDDYVKRNWNGKIVHEVEDFSSELEIEVRGDFADEDQEVGDIQNDDGSFGRKFLMSWATGKQVGRIARQPHTYLQLIFKNFAPDEPIRILNQVITATPQESR